ncbi:MAG: L-aspartate oxidase [Bacteroidetes bacterium CG2_30_33_31]|nr:MAG: L-aspartate oxidase [Bacteroidetes bacterium CG2_30_33_31]
MRRKTDFLVIGTGVAGLSYALKVAEHGNVVVVAKSTIDEGSTKYAQGGIAAVMYSPDTYEKHIIDTLVAGDSLCNEKIVRITITESSERVKELVEWGTRFDTNLDGTFKLGKEGGHSENRVLHRKDQTGKEIERALVEQVRTHNNITLLENHFAVDLITQHHLGIEIPPLDDKIECYGAYLMDIKTGKIETVLSKITLLATGGVGNVYESTTNPIIATGDGIAMAYRAGALIENMEFIQFHPTALYSTTEKPAFLITEALRGYGARLKNHKGEYFMKNYDERADLAPRDIVARAIDLEMKNSGKYFVWLDTTVLDKNGLIENFPGIYARCLSVGIDITKEMIPVRPTAHYSCGGIKVDEYSKTNIKNLYASGEVASTGLHGANRLASNSLLEALVFSHRAYIDSLAKFKSIYFKDDIPDWNDEGTVLNEEMILIIQSLKEVQSIMSNYVGIVRSNLRLNRALNRLELINIETEDLFNKSVLNFELCELRNVINVAYLIINMAINRKENRGLHYSIDYVK